MQPVEPIRICSWCNTPAPSWCEGCQEEFKKRSDVSTFSVEDRIAELTWFFEGPGSICEIPFGMIHERIEHLVGRPVWTHELGSPAHLLDETYQRFSNS